jgi:hypothetical protein
MRELPDDDAGDLDWLLFRQNDVISRRQALRVMPEADLRRHIASGRWARPHRGVYVAHNGQLSEAQRAWVGVFVGGRGRKAPLAGLSALAAHGLRGYETNAVHVYIPAARRILDAPHFVVVHRTRSLAPIDRSRSLPPRTSPVRSAIDAASWADSDGRARAIIAAAFQQRLVDVAAMRAGLARLARVRRRPLIEQTVTDVGGGSESAPELDFLRLCRRGGLPEPTRQSVTTDSAGRRRYRDAYFEPWRVHVEIDGAQHMAVEAWWADMQRQNAMWVAGDRVLRFPAWAIRNEPDKVIEIVRAALVAAGWRP